MGILGFWEMLSEVFQGMNSLKNAQTITQTYGPIWHEFLLWIETPEKNYFRGEFKKKQKNKKQIPTLWGESVCNILCFYYERLCLGDVRKDRFITRYI